MRSWLMVARDEGTIYGVWGKGDIWLPDCSA